MLPLSRGSGATHGSTQKSWLEKRLGRADAASSVVSATFFGRHFGHRPFYASVKSLGWSGDQLEPEGLRCTRTAGARTFSSVTAQRLHLPQQILPLAYHDSVVISRKVSRKFSSKARSSVDSGFNVEVVFVLVDTSPATAAGPR